MAKPKRILVDGTNLGLQMKGVGRYTYNTLLRLSQHDAVNEYHVLVRAGAALPPLPQRERFHLIPVELHNHYRHGLTTLDAWARRTRADVAWIPYETTVRLPCPYTVVCHDAPDLIDESQKAGGERPSPVQRVVARADNVLIRRSLLGAAMVFANSHFVGDWLTRIVGIPAARVRYAPCAPGADFEQLARAADRARVRRELDCADGYVLIFATGDRRENLNTALAVYDRLVRAGRREALVMAGARGAEADHWRAAIQTQAWRERVRIVPFLGENEMPALAGVYAAASAYLDLSLHEGFGMQVIEAMACGTPVVCSRRGALPEVAGDAAALVDPQDTEAIVCAVRAVLGDEAQRAAMVEKGIVRARTYNWTDTARTILQGLDALG